MTLKALPLLYINLGGEMVYILNHRLMAQNIPIHKVSKIIGDLLSTMFNQQVMQSMFQPEALYSHGTWKALFDKIAHSSVMKLNSTSMNKLYDLMVMVVKYQIVSCKRPQDILLVTLNHLDQVKAIGPQNDPILDQIFHTVYEQMRIHYSGLGVGNFMLIRSSLLHFFKDSKIRVSLFLKEKMQHNNGTFVLSMSGDLPIDHPMPGTIKVFTAEDSQPLLKRFDCGIRNMRVCNKRPVFSNAGDRVINLGTNMYATTNSVSTVKSRDMTSDADSIYKCDYQQPDPRAKAHIDFLTRLIGMKSTSRDGGSADDDEGEGGNGGKRVEFNLDLFNDDDDDEGGDNVDDDPNRYPRQNKNPCTKQREKTIDIDASKRNKSSHLSKVLDEMRITSNDDGVHSKDSDDDLYNLLDNN